MMRYGWGTLRLALAFGVAAAGAASAQITGTGAVATPLDLVDGTAAARRLVVDPGTFDEMPAGTSVGRAAPGASRRIGAPVGPRIELRRPGDASVFRKDEPVSVHVEFLPAADGAAPDMETLQVKVRKGWLGKDITDKVEPYVEGAAIQVPEVDFSGHTGDFRFEIHIRDTRGRPGDAQFRVTIRS